MDKEELNGTIDYLEEQFLRVRTTKTNILQVQSSLVNADVYTDNEEEYDRLFDAVDESLYEAKRKLREIIDNLYNSMN